MTSDWAREIKDRLTAREVFEYYGLRANPRGYCKCPFHSNGNERTPSLKCYDGRGGYHCFGCGNTGSVIDFVMRYFELPFKDTLRKLNEDFNLGLPMDDVLSDAQKREVAKAAYLRRKEREREDAEQNRILTAYYNALDRYTYFDRVIAEREGMGVEVSNGAFNDDEYITALKNIDTAKYLLDCAEADLREFEKKRGA